MQNNFRGDDYAWMNVYLAAKLNEIMAEQEMSASRLSRLSGIGKSTMSEILSPAHPKLPNLVTLYKICRVLNIAPSYLLDFLADWRSNKENIDRLQSAFLAPSEFHHSDFFRKLLYDIEVGDVVYFPTSIPEFMKSTEIMELEDADQSNISDYVSAINAMNPLEMTGLIVHDSHMLREVFAGRGIYEALSASKRRGIWKDLLSMSMLENWQDNSFVVDFRIHGYTPVLLTKTNLAAYYINGAYLLVQNELFSEKLRGKIYSHIESGKGIMALQDFLVSIEIN